MIEVEQLKLWRVLKDKGTDEQRALVQNLVGIATPILDRVVETFPTYTLHNSLHSRNVAELMADLLGDEIEHLSTLEAALLILAAYFHDIGMVFSDEERANLAKEKDWILFLSTHPEAYLAIKDGKEILRDVLETYCRWRHAERVFVYLNSIDTQKFRWGAVSLREELGELCRSHNLNTSEVRSVEKLRKSFLEAADLKFCAILLRLADILDFDRSRSPESVYRHLGLSRRASQRTTISDVEWLKHLNSDGMRFPASRTQSYELGFVCGPNHPAVEHDVRRFLDIIEDEFAHCEILLSECSSRWRNFALPGRINRDNINSDGYRYGEYRFTVDQDNVLELLMGENLYESPFVFVRELLQNAIDTSRLREYLEHSRGNASFQICPIKVTHWIDREGYRWVRFDDFGTGMDEAIITNYFLKVGNSYYDSVQYKSDILKADRKLDHSFVPISRFGIGLLSCFIACDRVDISTLRQNSDGSQGDPIRLSLVGLNGFFALQSPNLPAAPMPENTKEKFGSGYRSDCGTSIACRLNPAKERGKFDLSELLWANLFCPLIPIEFEGKFIGGNFQRVASSPWCQRASVTLSEDQILQLNEFTGWTFSVDDFVLDIVPIDLTRSAVSEDIGGQIVLFWLRYLKSDNILDFIHLAFRTGEDVGLRLQVSLRFNPDILEDIENDDVDIRTWFSEIISRRSRNPNVHSDVEIALPQADRLIITEAKSSLRGEKLRISHNGINVPLQMGFFSNVRLGLASRGFGEISAVVGGIVLQDKSRPNLSLARDEIKSWPWELLSKGDFSLVKALGCVDGLEAFRPTLVEVRSSNLALKDLLLDPILSGGLWDSQKIFFTPTERLSLAEIKERLVDGSTFELVDLKGGFGWSTAAAAIATINLELSFEGFSRRRYRISATAVRQSPLGSGELLFPPLTFVSYAQGSMLRGRRAFLNKQHPISKWLIEKASVIATAYPGILKVIRSELTKNSIDNQDELNELVGNVNGALERLIELDPSLVSAEAAKLSTEDIQWQLEDEAEAKYS